MRVWQSMWKLKMIPLPYVDPIAELALRVEQNSLQYSTWMGLSYRRSRTFRC